MTRRIRKIGIIAEDDSDFESTSILIKRIVKKNIGFKKSIGNGCGRLKRKSYQYAENLKARGCDLLIMIHDLDRNVLQDLYAQLHQSLKPSPIQNYFICIPIEELEAWFLSDPMAIKKTFSLKILPNIRYNPETIKSPKEYLGSMVYRLSKRERIYLNTRHNASLAEEISISELNKKCPSFRCLHDFLATQKFN